jgi:hypothetical protein
MFGILAYRCHRLLEQFAKLVLGKPNAFFFQPNINVDVTVLVLVDEYLAVVHAKRLESNWVSALPAL